jgi:hypothetical protein
MIFTKTIEDTGETFRVTEPRGYNGGGGDGGQN